VLLRRLRRGARPNGGAGGGDFVDPVSRGGVSSAVRRVLHGVVYFPDHANGWIPSATRAAVRAGREHGVAAVLSSSPPISAHVVALRAARALGVPAVLDFRDLWTAHREDTARGPRFDAERRLEQRLLRRAAAVTTVSDACREWLVARHGGAPTAPFVVLRNGYEESAFDDPAPAREPGVFRIVHTGTVYGEKQDLTAFFVALARLRNDGAFGPLRPEVVLAGKVDAQSLAAARAAGVDDLVRAPGFVPHHESIALLRTATVNLLLTWSVPGWVARGVCPGKMYEQIAAGRPVLALALADCEAGRVAMEAGGTLVADPHDEAGIRTALARLVAAEREGDANRAVPPRVADPTPYSRRAATRLLAETLDRVLS
jgi:glycosyltransferase involved in cell wall biosynthesis